MPRSIASGASKLISPDPCPRRTDSFSRGEYFEAAGVIDACDDEVDRVRADVDCGTNAAGGAGVRGAAGSHPSIMPAIRSCGVTGTETTSDPAVPAWPAEYAATRGRLCDLLRSATPAEAATIVPACPAWTVHDVIAHVGGLAVALSSGAGPGGHDLQGWLDGLVDERRRRPFTLLLDEWEAAAPAVHQMLETMGASGGQLVYDLVAHEHDIRQALGRPGVRESSSVVACAAAVSMLLARDSRGAWSWRGAHHLGWAHVGCRRGRCRAVDHVGPVRRCSACSGRVAARRNCAACHGWATSIATCPPWPTCRCP